MRHKPASNKASQGLVYHAVMFRRNITHMGKIITRIFGMLFLVPCLASGSDFRVDMSITDVMEKYKVLTIGSLAVGETGLVSIYGLRECIENGRLKVSSISELENSPSKYSYVFEVTRKPNDYLEIVFSTKGKTPDEEAVMDAAKIVAEASDCEALKKAKIPILSVSTFLGSESLKGVVAQSSPVIEKSENAGEPELKGSKIKSILSEWIVSESKSPIDDSPSVTMFKTSESGDQALVLRCKEDTTDAYIRTDEYLSNESTNVIVRYDSEKAEEQKFSLSTNNSALFFSPAILNIKKMLRSKQLVLRYTSYNGTPHTTTFKIGELSKQIQPLRAACHW